MFVRAVNTITNRTPDSRGGEPGVGRVRSNLVFAHLCVGEVFVVLSWVIGWIHVPILHAGIAL